MAVTYGFYNSLNGDRTYNAEQMSAIFDGIITDGVFGSIGGALMTIAGEGMQVIVKTGKAWFNGTWTLNDAQMAIPVDTADVSLTRIDAVVLEVNSSVSVRENSIKIVKGTPSANPTKPTMAADEDLHQYALAYITVASGVASITAANIEVNVGKDDCPFITSVLQQTSITDLFNQWDAEFDAWFANIKAQLAGDVATNLQRQIDELKISKTAQTQYGLSSVLPTDYIEWIGKYNEHWWSLQHGQAYSYTKYEADVFTAITNETYLFTATNASGITDTTIYYSKNVAVSDSGVISLTTPNSLAITSTSNAESLLKSICSILASNAPCYVTTTYNPGVVYYIPNGATAATMSGSGGTIQYIYNSSNNRYSVSLGSSSASSYVKAQIVSTTATIVNVPAGETTYEHSTDRNAYPDSGTVDGITYTYLGVPFDDLRLISVSKIDIMSYVGVGKTGSSNPTKLIFNKKPRAFMVYGSNVYITWISDCEFPLSIYRSSNSTYMETTTVTWDGSIANVYSENSMSGAIVQANQKNGTYYVIAFY